MRSGGKVFGISLASMASPVRRSINLAMAFPVSARSYFAESWIRVLSGISTRSLNCPGVGGRHRLFVSEEAFQLAPLRQI